MKLGLKNPNLANLCQPGIYAPGFVM